MPDGPLSFVLLPAVDAADGQVVRLVQGEAGSETRYGAPLDAALAWQADGPQCVHLVDLDAAFGRGSNRLTLRSRADSTSRSRCPAGSANNDSLTAALATGCARVNIGTAALERPERVRASIARHGDRIAVGLDVRGTTLFSPWLDAGRPRTVRCPGPARRGRLRPVRRHRSPPPWHPDRAERRPAARRVRGHRPAGR